MRMAQHLLAGIDTVEPVEPTSPMPEGAIEVGELPPELRQISGLWDRTRQESAELVAQYRENGSEELLAQVAQKWADAVMLVNLFKFEVRAAFGIADESHVGVAEGWKVWKMVEEQCPCVDCVLDRINSMFGVGGVKVFRIFL
jgi:hypothetical protein